MAAMKWSEWTKALATISLVTYIGLIISASIYIGFFVGHRLDAKLNTGYVLTVVGLTVGVASGFWGAYRVAMRLIERVEK